VGSSIFEKGKRPKGLELFYIKPIVLGGNPNDPTNITWLTRQQHVAAVRYWNAIIRNMKGRGG